MAVSNFVESVEHLEISIDSTATLSGVLLTKGQNPDNCVPFYTLNSSSDNFDAKEFDVYFTGTSGSATINFERDEARSSTSTIQCYVVEFIPSQVRVQQGSFSMVSTTTDTVNLPTSIVTEKSAMTFGWKCTDGNQYSAPHAVRARVVSSGTVDFYRYTGSGNLDGHWFLFEDLNDNFYVRHLEDQVSGFSKYVSIPNNETVDFLRSFLISSFACSNTSTYPSRSIARTSYYTRGTLRFDRNDSSYAVYWAGQVVEFIDKSKIYTPFDQSYHGSFTNSTSREVAGISGFTGYLCNPETSSVVYAGPQGFTRLDVNTASYLNEISMAVSLTASGTLNYSKVGNSISSYISNTSVVDWAGIDIDIGTNNNVIPEGDGPEQSFVKSVENFRIELTETLNYRALSKGQQWDNCVVFCSYRTTSSNDNWQSQLFNVWIDEPGIVCAHRYGTNGSGYVDVSVVEFWPNQVKVQHKVICPDEVSTFIEDIDPVSDVDKAFIVMTQFTYDSSSEIHNVGYRASFATTSGIEFYKYDTGNYMDVSYFVVEDLGNNFNVSHYLVDSSVNSTRFLSMDYDYGKHNTLCLFSCAGSSTSNYPSRNFAGGFWHSESSPMWIHRFDTSFNMYYAMTVIRFVSDKYRVQQFYRNETSFSADTYTERFIGHEHALSCVTPSSLSAGALNTSTVGYYQEAFFTTRISDYENRTVDCVKYGTSISNLTGYAVVDWIGAHYQSENNIERNTPTRSLVQSLEKFIFLNNTDRWLECDLTKGQNIDKCVPFVSCDCHASSDNYFIRGTKGVYRYSDPDLFRVSFGAEPTGGRNVTVNVVEFSDEINVKYGNAITNDVSVDVTIDPVNLDRAFLHFYSYASNWSESAENHLVCGYFTSSSGIRFVRNNTGDIVNISWYIVECPNEEDYWTVQHLYDPTNNSGTDVVYGPLKRYSMSKSMILLSYSHSNTSNYPSRNFYRTTLWASGDYNLQRNDGSYAITNFNAETIEMKDSFKTKGFRSISVGVTHTSATTDFTLDADSTSSGVDTYRSFVVTSNPNSSGRSNTNTASYGNGAYHHYQLIDNGNVLRSTSKQTSATSTSQAYIYEWPIPNAYYVEGYVKEQGSPVTREVRIYRASTCEITDKTVSRESDGYFLLESPYYDAHYVVCLDDEGGLSYNDLVFGKIYPTTISGCWMYNEGFTMSGIAASVPEGRQ